MPQAQRGQQQPQPAPPFGAQRSGPARAPGAPGLTRRPAACGQVGPESRLQPRSLRPAQPTRPEASRPAVERVPTSANGRTPEKTAETALAPSARREHASRRPNYACVSEGRAGARDCACAVYRVKPPGGASARNCACVVCREGDSEHDWPGARGCACVVDGEGVGMCVRALARNSVLRSARDCACVVYARGELQAGWARGTAPAPSSWPRPSRGASASSAARSAGPRAGQVRGDAPARAGPASAPPPRRAGPWEGRSVRRRRGRRGRGRGRGGGGRQSG